MKRCQRYPIANSKLISHCLPYNNSINGCTSIARCCSMILILNMWKLLIMILDLALDERYNILKNIPPTYITFQSSIRIRF